MSMAEEIDVDATADAFRRISESITVTGQQAAEAFAKFGEAIREAHDALMMSHPLYAERMAWVTAPWYVRISGGG